MTRLNAALQVDLFDQANASRVKDPVHSGFGGSTDVIVGALHIWHSFVATEQCMFVATEQCMAPSDCPPPE